MLVQIEDSFNPVVMLRSRTSIELEKMLIVNYTMMCSNNVCVIMSYWDKFKKKRIKRIKRTAKMETDIFLFHFWMNVLNKKMLLGSKANNRESSSSAFKINQFHCQYVLAQSNTENL